MKWEGSFSNQVPGDPWKGFGGDHCSPWSIMSPPAAGR